MSEIAHLDKNKTTTKSFEWNILYAVEHIRMLSDAKC